ncbi:MAG: ribonuclease J [Oscillospiraceae bacterium]|jgi:ribonuclease J|nr:ribonuclease J [Oscillospiraceae bacterium]
MSEKEKKVVLDASVRGKKPYVLQKGERSGAVGTEKPQQQQKKRGRPARVAQQQPAVRAEVPKPPAPAALPSAATVAAQKMQAAQQIRQQQPARRGKSPRSGGPDPLRICFLGGLNEVGKNLTVYEYRGERIAVDCGLAFPDQDMPGVDLVIPDFTFLEENYASIKGVVITHGHEDHIGALPYLLKRINVPIYGTKLTLGLIRGKLREHRLLEKAKLHEVKPGDLITLGGFQVEAIHVNHSIPDALGYAITCGAGTVIQTGDFKIDTTPIDGGMIDLARFAHYGKKGVLALLSDSTNAERPGYTMSESKVGESFGSLFRRAGDRRILVATFSSNVHRVQQIMDVAQALGRKVALLGRSLENVVNVGMELGYLRVPEGLLISVDMIQRYTPEQLVIITTGSQGEPMSALTRMSLSDHRKVEIGPQDCIFISATPIPGNEKAVGKVINELLKLGAQVVYESMYDVHVSGHACQEELKLMLGLVRPKYFIPVHGEQKHLAKHAGLAQSMGINPHNIMIADNGVCLELSNAEMRVGEPVQAGPVFVDGYGVGDVGSTVLRDRKHLAQDGIIIVAATVERETGRILTGPEIISKGFVYVKESEDLMLEAKERAIRALEETHGRYSLRDWNQARGRLREDISRLMYERTKRSPIIVPMVMES